MRPHIEEVLMRQIKETAAIALIGDGVLGIVRPSAHCSVWRIGNPGWDAAVGWFARRPLLVRAIAAVEIAAGLLLATRQFAHVRTQADSSGDMS